mgnify:CR=1 FL=1
MQKLKDICEKALVDLGLDKDQRYVKRLRWELAEIDAKGKENYFLNLIGKKYAQNVNNLLVVYLLKVVDHFVIEKEPRCEYGEYPDIDVDYISEVRDYLKHDWAPRTFGQDYVCNIGNYTTFGIKNSLLDMARVHAVPYDEIQELTKDIEPKDDEGKAITWDAAMRLYPKLKSYCEKYPEVAEAARRMLHRNRGSGQHAGGLIVASIPLHDLVPLIKRKDNPQASAWTEGLNGQDLGPVGLVKFDLLVIANLLQISKCCELVKKYHKLDSICALPGLPDWTDVEKWRNDPDALAMANQGDLKCIFQFDSEGIRKMVRAGGVTSFDDLVAYTALYRPGPLGMKMQERYIQRKKGQEEYHLHPLVKPILDPTYGVLTYQEQIMRILNVVGEIPLKDCEALRKAISKKKEEIFGKYKEQFIFNGMKNLNCTIEEVTNLWDQIAAFAEYGFNLSHACAYTYVSSRLLYLKAHYPHEFYTAVLSCEKTSDKIKEYKIEAHAHNVELMRLDINKSKFTFELIDNKIYYGFFNIKGIGESAAQRIVDNQPYTSFEDFLYRFGTDANVLKPLIGLRCFKDADPVVLWKFVEYYRDKTKKHEDKIKRYAKSLQKYDDDFHALCPNENISLRELAGQQPFDAEYWQRKYDIDETVEVEKEMKAQCEEEGSYGRRELISLDENDVIVEQEVIQYYKMGKVTKTYNRWKELRKLWNRRQKAIEKNENIGPQVFPKLVDFDPSTWPIGESLLMELRDVVECENKFYGFAWIHELEKSPDYNPSHTFENLRQHSDFICPVEVKIKSIVRTESKTKKPDGTPKTIYYRMKVEDVMSEENTVNVWEDDYARWGGILKPDNLVRLRLQAPSGGYPTYTLETNRVAGKPWMKRYPDKENDFRVYLMKPPVVEVEKYQTEDETFEQLEEYAVGPK